MKKIPDEKMLESLLANGSIRRAAVALGCSAATIRNRLKNTAFRQRYDEERATLLADVTEQMKSKVTAAVDTLHAVMTDENCAASVRVSAADSLLRHTLRFVEITELSARIAALERLTEGEGR